MSKPKKIYFDATWKSQCWFLMPTIILTNFVDQFCIHFHFMSFWFEIAYIKKGGEKETMRDKLKQIISHYGANHQFNKLFEECGELIQAVSKWMQKPACEKLRTPHEVITELADVQNMLEQMKIIFDCHEEVAKEAEYKINRQLDRIAKGE